MINLENKEKLIIQEKKYYKYVDFNLLARINDDIGVCTSLNDYYIIFDLNKGNIIKRIEFDKTHFICQMEKNQKIEQEKLKNKKNKKKLEGEIDDESIEKEEEKQDNKNFDYSKENKEIKLIK